MTPTSRPLDELATHLADLAGVDVVAIKQQLADRPDQAHLLVRQALRARRHDDEAPAPVDPAGPEDGRLVLVVDQFEQLYTLDHTADPDQPSAFLTALLAAAGTRAGRPVSRRRWSCLGSGVTSSTGSPPTRGWPSCCRTLTSSSGL